MEFSFSINIAGAIVTITVEGRMDQNSALTILDSFTTHPDFRSHYGICFDVRKNTYIPGYTEVSSFYIEYGRRYKHRITGKVAFIVNNPLQFGIARMASTILSASLPDMEIFMSSDEALRWLRQ
ncbi:MAG: hypothetical protein ACOYNS_04655 [Bacteroidota bacterium]